jgi:hypothetical protein
MTSAGLVKASLTPALTKPEEEKTLEAVTKNTLGVANHNVISTM